MVATSTDDLAPESRRSPVRPQSVAELVADVLRERIVSGQVRPGDVLPKQEDLLLEFGVSKPSLREALRILESEGLVRVRRGKIGGTVVQQIHLDSTVHGIELALRSRGVSADEVATALSHLEPTCARLCAARKDRRTTVVPRLQAAHEAVEAAIDDVPVYTARAREFHAELVDGCGNDTIALVLGALQRICADDSYLWAQEIAGRPTPVNDLDYRNAGVAAHAAILECIERGDEAGAEAAARSHVESRTAARTSRRRRSR